MESSPALNVWLEKIARHIPISIYQALYKRDVILFFYHVISDRPLPHLRHLYAYKTPEMFEHDLAYLLKNHALISYEQLAAYRQGRLRLKPNSVFLSFDDGYRECFTVARPLLLKYGAPCTFFITTDLIDNQSMFFRQKVSMCIDKVATGQESWQQAAFERLNRSFGRSIQAEQDFIDWIKSFQYADQSSIDQVCEALEIDIAGYLKAEEPFMTLDELRTLAADGFTLGAHSKSHPLLEQLPPQTVEREMVESCQTIQDITQAESVPFAFPFYGDGLERGLLEEICARNKVVGALFDTNGIKQHQGLVLDRIWADAPEWDGRGRSNLPGLLYLTYQDLALAGLRKYQLYR